jgi:hypothetical protein
MRLIHVKTHELREFNEPPNDFAILSHRWIEDQEVRLQDWEAYVAQQEPTSSQVQCKSGFIKIQNACAQAKKRGLEWMWADTACIDKTNHLEVGKSINLMFSWYQSASVCFVYLHDTSNGSHHFEWIQDPPAGRKTPEWFTRGWTLQELLAPSKVLFFNQDWNCLGDRGEFAEVINKLTSIPLDVLGGKDIWSYSHAERLSWAKGRQTKEPEDRVYSLLGLLGVSLPAVGYGIGLKSALWQLESAIDRQRVEGNLSLPDDELFSRFITDMENIPTGTFGSRKTLIILETKSFKEIQQLICQSLPRPLSTQWRDSTNPSVCNTQGSKFFKKYETGRRVTTPGVSSG